MIHEEERIVSYHKCYNCGRRIEILDEEPKDIIIDFLKYQQRHKSMVSEHSAVLKSLYWKKEKRKK